MKSSRNAFHYALKSFAKEAKEETKGSEETNLFFCHYVPERNLPPRRKSI